ncbi:MAG: hypothetical protein ACFCU1_09925 [Sumerlaeia bacterium]
MKDKLLAQLKLLLEYIDYIAVAVFIGLLGASYVLYTQEENFTITSASTVRENPWDDKFSAMTEDDLVIESFVEVNPDIRQDERARRLVQVNMFDSQSIKEQIRVEEAVRDDYAQAEIEFNNGNYDAAKRLAESILQRYPVHLKSQRLLQQIDEQLSGAGEAVEESVPETTPDNVNTLENELLP